jgi:adenylate cyclase
MKKIFTHWSFAFVTLFVLTWIGFQDPQIKEVARLKSFDIHFQNQEKVVSEDIAIVTIDEKSIEVYGQWPWRRDVLAGVIEELRAAEVGVIVLPILFSEEDRLGGDEVLANILKDNFVVISQTGSHQTTQNGYPRGVAKIGNPLEFLFEWPGMVGPIEELGQNAAGVGTTNTAPEIDGVVRRMPLLMKIGNDVYPNIAIEVIRVAVGDPSYQVKADNSGIIAMRVPGFATINTDANARIWLTCYHCNDS